MIKLSWEDVAARAIAIAKRLPESGLNLWGVPNGGIPAALAVQAACHTIGTPIIIVEDPSDADAFIDDIIDSGATKEALTKTYHCRPFYALVDKTNGDTKDWWSFPWERAQANNGPQDNIRRILQYIGEDPGREGLKETPDRVVRSYGELFAGYKQDPATVFKVFEDGACDEMVLLKNIEWVSFCEHHMLPFIGRAHIAYIPNGKVIGISKLARILDIYSRRLQVQERLTEQVTRALDTYLQPKGSACVLKASHLCMTCRGVQKQHSEMVTSSLTGAFRQPEVRQEFFSLIK